eukprot:2689896-Amphidinium_carterae.1
MSWGADELSLDEEFAVAAALALLDGRLDAAAGPGRCEGEQQVRIGGVLCEPGSSKLLQV